MLMSLAVPFMRGWRVSAAATAWTIRSVYVASTGPRARSATRFDASTSRMTKKCGASRQLLVTFSAIARHSAGSAGATVAPDAWSTSCSTTAPSGPVPANREMSTPCSSASLLAFGEAGGRDVAATGNTGLGSPHRPCGPPPRGRGGGDSPGARISAIRWPTATSSPSAAVIALSVPVPGDSTSTVALSVSTSISGSPLATWSPSCFSQRTSLPVSWAMPSAGMTTSIAMSSYLCAFAFGGLNHRTLPVGIQVRLGLADRRQVAAGGVVAPARDEQLFGREACDDLGAVLGHDHLLLDPRCRPSISRRPEGLQREHHVLLDHLGVVEGNQTREHGL